MKKQSEHSRTHSRVRRKGGSGAPKRNRFKLAKKRVSGKKRPRGDSASKILAGPIDRAASLHRLWSEEKSNYLADFDEAAKLARDANRAGEHFLAIDIAEGISEVGGDRIPIALRQAQALALARSGSPERALQILTPL